jgi:GDP-4-dehydro-6-deoxy-D-mannose reductase
MTTLVTGAAGFVGTHLVDAFYELDGAPPVGADVRPPPFGVFRAFHLVDFRDDAAVRLLLRSVRPERVVHLIGGAHGDDCALDDLNIGSARRLLQSLEAEDLEASTVLLGSAAEYGAVPVALQPVSESFEGVPTTAYGRAKSRLSRLASDARLRGQRVSVARPFNIIGAGVPNSLVCGALIERIRGLTVHGETNRLAVGRTNGIRDFVAVEDVARGIALLACHPAPAPAYNLCTGTGRTVQDLLDKLLQLADLEIVVESDADLFRSGDVDQIVGSSARAHQDLGWAPRIEFEEAVARSWRWANRSADPS